MFQVFRKFKQISQLLGGLSVYDPVNKIYWLEFAVNVTINLYGIDVNNGRLVKTVENTLNLETGDWDPATGKGLTRIVK